jgi:hypothetical protein
MVDPMFRFFAGSKSSAIESSFIKSSATAWFKTPAWWPAEPASGFLWYCHLFFFVKSRPGRDDCFYFINSSSRV